MLDKFGTFAKGRKILRNQSPKLSALPDAVVTVDGGGGHFTIEVISAAFEGKNTLQRQRII